MDVKLFYPSVTGVSEELESPYILFKKNMKEKKDSEYSPNNVSDHNKKKLNFITLVCEIKRRQQKTKRNRDL